jgi:S-adenosylmethionine decarboxylase
MIPEEEHLFHGVHVFGELYGVESKLLDDVKLLESALKKGISKSGATLCNIQIKQFEPNGITILALLSESHASIHTYPEKGALFFDAFTCGDRCKPEQIAEALIEALNPRNNDLNVIKRGDVPGQNSLKKEKTGLNEATYS